jgi:hypothetical protein
MSSRDVSNRHDCALVEQPAVIGIANWKLSAERNRYRYGRATPNCFHHLSVQCTANAFGDYRNGHRLVGHRWNSAMSTTRA